MIVFLNFFLYGFVSLVCLEVVDQDKIFSGEKHLKVSVEECVESRCQNDFLFIILDQWSPLE